MIVIYDKEQQRIPIKAWVDDRKQIEQGAFIQALNLSNLPFAFRHVVLLPDVHEGFGMPIGGVLATKNAVIPNAVGVDIGCGMVAMVLDFPAEQLRQIHTPNGTLAQAIAGSIMRTIPLGFDHRKKPAPVDIRLKEGQIRIKELMDEFEKIPYQCGTLGGGNHFIELQEDIDSGETVLMIHSGSRNFGYKVAKYFNDIAKEINKKKFDSVPSNWQLACLPLDDETGVQYLNWMSTALEFAALNRDHLATEVLAIVTGLASKYAGESPRVLDSVKCHHNYAAMETHYGEKVMVHRKGAIRAGKGDRGIIPGAMGGYSYIVKGLGNEESFMSASHGAGRVMSRKAAKDRFSVQEMMAEMNSRNVVLGVKKREAVVDEHIKAYKDIDAVIANETDLVEPERKLRTVMVVKG